MRFARARRSLIGLFLWVSMFCSAGSARANLGAPVPAPSELAAPATSAASALRVDDEELVLRCREQRGEPVCDFQARYSVANPAHEAVGGVGAFYGVRTADVHVRVDGARADAPLDAASQSALDAAVLGALGELWNHLPPELERSGFRIQVPSGRRVALEATGTMRAERTHRQSYEMTAVAGRHPLLHAGDPDPRDYVFMYLVAPLRTWSGRHRIRLRVSAPSDWQAELFVRPRDRNDAAPPLRGEGVNDWSVELSADEIDAIMLSVVLPGSAIEHGGPFVAVGGVTGGHEASGLRVRFGWEFAAPSSLVHSLGVDLGRTPAGFGERIAFAVQTEVASPHVLILPSVAAGIGAVLEVEPETAVGGRLLGTIQFYPVGFVVAFDVFPKKEPEAGRTQLALLGRLSF